MLQRDEKKLGGYLGVTFKKSDRESLELTMKEWCPDNLQRYLKDSGDYHMTMKAGPADKPWGQFTLEQLTAAQNFNSSQGLETRIGGFVALWGGNSNYVYIGPKIEVTEEINSLFKSVGSRDGFSPNVSILVVPKDVIIYLKPELEYIPKGWQDVETFSAAVLEAFGFSEIKEHNIELSNIVFEEFNSGPDNQVGTLNSRENLLDATINTLRMQLDYENGSINMLSQDINDVINPTTTTTIEDGIDVDIVGDNIPSETT